MTSIGTVESLWRYPVKSMRGEELEEAEVRFGGLAGDRLCAFRSSAARVDFPYFTARQQHAMLQYRPRISDDGAAVQVEMPGGGTCLIDDPALIESLRAGVDATHQLSLMRSEHALADAHPISVMSVQTARRLADETGTAPEKRRFRANIYIDLPGSTGFAEDEFVGRALRIGDEVVVAILKRDSRCLMINLDPDTAEMEPSILKAVGQHHGGTAGVYGNVVSEGVVRRGDPIALVEPGFERIS